jgi:RHS repeat-associated protein
VIANVFRRWWVVVSLSYCALAAGAEDAPSNITEPEWPVGQYSYDGAGNIRSIGPETFVYDELGRVKSRTVDGTVTQQYTYDAFGNILSITTGSEVLSPCVGPATNQIDRVSTQDAPCNAQGVYGPSGNMEAYGQSATFVYDSLDMVKDSTVAGKRTVYLYTASDERIGSVGIINATRVSSEWTVRGADGRVLTRFNESGGAWNWSEDYIYRDSQLLAAEVPGPERTLHFYPDHLGTPRLITGSGGAEISRHTYYPFGRELTSPTQDSERAKFTAHERDDINLDYMHARYYLPYAGRFLSVDPVIDMKKALRRPQMWNRYAYVSNNPLNATDPDGRSEFRLDNQLGREQLAVVNGDMTMDQYIDTQAVRFNAAMTAFSIVEGFGAVRSVIGLIRGASGLARGSIGLDAAIARGAIREGGALSKIVGGIEAGVKRGAPKSAEAALEVVAKSAEAAGMKPGTMVKATDGAKYVLQNVGDVKTFIYKNGAVIVKKGDEVLVRLIPK